MFIMRCECGHGPSNHEWDDKKGLGPCKHFSCTCTDWKADEANAPPAPAPNVGGGTQTGE